MPVSKFTPPSPNMRTWGQTHNTSQAVETDNKPRPRPEFKTGFGKISIRTGANVTRARTKWAKFKRFISNALSFLQAPMGTSLSTGNVRRRNQHIRHAGYALDKGINKLVTGIANGTIKDSEDMGKALSSFSDAYKTLDKANENPIHRMRCNVGECLRVIRRELGQEKAQQVLDTLQSINTPLTKKPQYKDRNTKTVFENLEKSQQIGGQDPTVRSMAMRFRHQHEEDNTRIAVASSYEDIKDIKNMDLPKGYLDTMNRYDRADYAVDKEMEQLKKDWQDEANRETQEVMRDRQDKSQAQGHQNNLVGTQSKHPEIRNRIESVSDDDGGA